VALHEPLFRFRTLISQSYLLVGALTGGETSKDAPALDLLRTLLGDGRASRLHRRLVDQEAWTDEVLAVSFQVSNVGAFGAGLVVAPDLTEQARTVLLDEMTRLAREPVSPEELDTARKRIRGQMAIRFETNSGVAEFRSRRLLHGQPVAQEEYLTAIGRLSTGDLQRVADTYWGRDDDEASRGPMEIQVLPARGFGKVIAALKYLFFRRL
jgi:predicted Zn-dependent peptidase